MFSNHTLDISTSKTVEVLSPSHFLISMILSYILYNAIPSLSVKMLKFGLCLHKSIKRKSIIDMWIILLLYPGIAKINGWHGGYLNIYNTMVGWWKILVCVCSQKPKSICMHINCCKRCKKCRIRNILLYSKKQSSFNRLILRRPSCIPQMRACCHSLAWCAVYVVVYSAV